MGAVRLRPARPEDRAALSRLLRDLSPDSEYLRFQTALGPDPRPAVLDALLPAGGSGGAMLAHAGARLVGHGVWRRSGSTSLAEIGLVVADDHQGRGIGSLLAEALIADLLAHGIDRVEVYSSATNHPVARMVAGRAPDAVAQRDGATLTYLVHAPPGAPVRTVA